MPRAEKKAANQPLDGVREAPVPRFKPPSRTSITQNVLDQILAEIREGRIKPGERLPSERQLMEEFAVGRSTIREAIRGLATLGLVTNRQGRVATVTTQAASPLASLRRNADLEQLNKRALLDLLEVRVALEGTAAELAAKRATAADISELEKHHTAMERDVRNSRSYFRPNALFHTGVATAAHNPVLAESITLLHGQLREYQERMMREIPTMSQKDVEEHLAIIEAIRGRDAAGARMAMVTHIENFVTAVERKFTALEKS